MKKTIILILATLFACPLFAQYGRLDQYSCELGLQGGCSFYLGDANPNAPFHTPRPSFGGFFRYNINPRYALKLAVSRNGVKGDTRDFKNRFPNNAEASFKRNFLDVSARAEFNFFDYGLPAYNRDCKWFSPYIFVGIGLTTYNDEYQDMKRKTVNMPYGIGVKFKFKGRFNAGVEWSLHTLFIDDFDVVDEESAILDNPYKAATSKWKHNDKYSIAMAYISIDIFRRGFCHR
ncbi:MAG: outer membrane beta-barrel protein [Paludibacteraceae bacterium]|nr:outer membrane beta-barrel protein [Paludibacteraceae bacterium]